MLLQVPAYLNDICHLHVNAMQWSDRRQSRRAESCSSSWMHCSMSGAASERQPAWEHGE